jgi:hypothetical protein
MANPMQLFNLVDNLTKGGTPSLAKFGNLFQGVGGGVDGLATMIINTQNGLQNDISGQISKITDEIKRIAIANATYLTHQALGKDVTGMPSAESLIKSINERLQSELKDMLERAKKAIMKPFDVAPTSPSGPILKGGFKTGKTLKNVSVTHRRKTHRRSPVVSKI